MKRLILLLCLFVQATHIVCANPVYYSFSDSICAGDSYVWEGVTYAEAGDYVRTFASVAGGDSIVTLHLYYYPCVEKTTYLPYCYKQKGTTVTLSMDEGEYIDYRWEKYVNGEWQILSTGSLSQTVRLPQSRTDTLYIRFVGQELYNNLIVNGDFEAGNTGFETGYIYNQNGITAEGTYAITNDVNTVHYAAECNADHTTGHGMMMAINGGSDENANVWTQTITALQPNTDYAFSAWSALWTDYGMNYPELEFSINDQLQGQQFSPNSGTCNWTQLYTVWNSGNNTSAQIRLVDRQTGAHANDFCIDDIYFSPLYGNRGSYKEYFKIYLSLIIKTSFSDTIRAGETYHWQGKNLTTSGDYTKQFESSQGCDSIVTLHLTVLVPPEENYNLSFSTSDTTSVFFSPGNLQYRASTNTWRFAEHQWDYVGTQNDTRNSSKTIRQHGNVYENGVICDNALISSTYNGWIDLFCWGTSGWNSGVSRYQPWSASLPNSQTYDTTYLWQYFHSGDLTGEYANADWGIYNQIGEDQPGTWRTPTEAEWVYMLTLRPNAEFLRGIGMVNGVPGLILLPDSCKWDTLPFNPGLIEYRDMDWTIVSDNTLDYAINQYTTAQWEEMEKVGAIFLPAAGERYYSGASVYYNETDYYGKDVPKQQGKYWSSSFSGMSYGGAPNATVLKFDPYYFIKNLSNQVYYGMSVRLIRDCFSCNAPHDNPQPVVTPIAAEPQRAKIVLQNNAIYLLMPDGTRYDMTGRRVN